MSAAVDTSITDQKRVQTERSPRMTWTGYVGVAFVLFWVLMALLGSTLAPYHQADMVADKGFLPMDRQFWLGSDYLGRDTLSRIMWGASTTIGISVAATLLAYCAGVTLGIAAAVKGGWTDNALSRANDVAMALPDLMLALIVIAALGSSIPILIVITAVVYTPGVFRLSRALGHDIMVQDFVEAARARGEGVWWIVRREVLPNAVMPLATDFGFRVAFVILFISSLSFLGLGIQPPMADWGSMVRENMQGLSYGAMAAIWPALAIASLTISINLIVDDLSAKSASGLAGKMA